MRYKARGGIKDGNAAVKKDLRFIPGIDFKSVRRALYVAAQEQYSRFLRRPTLLLGYVPSDVRMYVVTSLLPGLCCARQS